MLSENPSFSGCHYRTDARSGRRPLCEGDRHLRRRTERNPYGLLRPQLSDPLRLPIGTPARPHRRHLYAHGRLSGTNLHGRHDRPRTDPPAGTARRTGLRLALHAASPSSTILRPRTPTSPSAARRIPAPTPPCTDGRGRRLGARQRRFGDADRQPAAQYLKNQGLQTVFPARRDGRRPFQPYLLPDIRFLEPARKRDAQRHEPRLSGLRKPPVEHRGRRPGIWSGYGSSYYRITMPQENDSKETTVFPPA